ncbi:MAG: RNA polymerase sigma factor [Ramlibacter sp.]
MNDTAVSTTPDPAAASGDAELAARAARGEAGAFEAIMRRHNRMVFRAARSILRSDAEAEEAVQDAYLKAWRALGSFRAEAKLSTWLVRIAINEALQRARRRSATVIPLDGAAALQEDPPGPADRLADDADLQPDRMLGRAQLRRVMEAHIDALPEVFRTVFVLRAVEELSVDEVADVLHVPAATVRTRFFRARALLRDGLSRELDFATEEAFSFAGSRCDRIVAGVLAALARDPLPPPA